MSTSDEHEQGRGARRARKWIGISAAVCAAVIAVGAEAVVPAGSPVANPPGATATATAWVPRPVFGPRPAPRPGSAIGQTQKPRPATADAPDWGTKANPSFQAMQEALGGLGNALNGSDIGAVQAACQQLSSAGARFAATLPAPGQQLTAQAQGAVDEINAMSDACVGESPDLDAVVIHASAANDHLVAVANMAG